MNKPLVSIIVPLYNYSKFIKHCIKSIIRQDYDNYELIVVDDFSSDNSYDVAKKFESDKIRVIRMDENRGYSKAKNEGIIISKGELITCLDADDMLTKNSLSCRVAIFQAFDNIPFVHARAIDVYHDISLNQCYQIQKKDIVRTNARIHAQTVMVKRWVYQKYGLYDEKLRSRSDKEMWWRLFGNDKVAGDEPKITKRYIKNDVAYYRRHEESMISMRNKNPEYDERVTQLLYQQYDVRKKQGITKENTRFLGT